MTWRKIGHTHDGPEGERWGSGPAHYGRLEFDEETGDVRFVVTRVVAENLPAQSPGSPTPLELHADEDAAGNDPGAWPHVPGYVYVASSWRNPSQPAVVEAITGAGIEAYDFRHPEPGDDGFAWSEIDPAWQSWTAEQYVEALDHPRAVEGFGKDFAAMQRADTFVLVLPCGRSAHLELGWAVGAGKRTAILLNGNHEPELMAKMVDHIAVDLSGLMTWLVPGTIGEATR